MLEGGVEGGVGTADTGKEAIYNGVDQGGSGRSCHCQEGKGGAGVGVVWCALLGIFLTLPSVE